MHMISLLFGILIYTYTSVVEVTHFFVFLLDSQRGLVLMPDKTMAQMVY